VRIGVGGWPGAWETSAGPRPLTVLRERDDGGCRAAKPSELGMKPRGRRLEDADERVGWCRGSIPTALGHWMKPPTVVAGLNGSHDIKVERAVSNSSTQIARTCEGGWCRNRSVHIPGRITEICPDSDPGMPNGPFSCRCSRWRCWLRPSTSACAPIGGEGPSPPETPQQNTETGRMAVGRPWPRVSGRRRMAGRRHTRRTVDPNGANTGTDVTNIAGVRTTRRRTFPIRSPSTDEKNRVAIRHSTWLTWSAGHPRDCSCRAGLFGATSRQASRAERRTRRHDDDEPLAIFEVGFVGWRGCGRKPMFGHFSFSWRSPR